MFSLGDLRYRNIIEKVTNMIIREFEDRDVIEVAKLSRKIFKKFTRSDYFDKSNDLDKEGIQGTLNFFDTEKRSVKEIIECFKSKSIFYVAENDSKIIGMIRGTSQNISSLYIDKKEHKKGIGTKLLKKYEEKAIKQGSDLLTLESTIYAMPFYQKMGFKKMTDIVNSNGMKAYIMEKTLSRKNF